MDLSIQSYWEIADDIGAEVAGNAGGGGHGAALRDCLTTNYERLHRRLLRFLRCPDAAGDCLHDAWLRLGEMTIMTPVQHPVAYVYRVACNIAMDRLRSHRLRQGADDVDAFFDSAVDPSPGPAAVAQARSELAAMARALDRLPLRHQAVLMALRVQELTRQEVAAMHGISLRQVDTVLRQALDYCAAHTGHAVLTGARGPRRLLPQACLRA